MSVFNLARLPLPASIKQVDYETNFMALLDKFKTLQPEYDAYLESDPVIKIFEACAYVLTLKDQERNDQIKAILIAFANGADLDNLGALLAEARQENEEDERFRIRILTALDKASTAGAAEAYEALSVEADARVADVKAYDDITQPAKAFVTIQSNMSDNGEADSELIGVVASYLNHEDRKPLGAQVIVGSVEALNYQIDAVVKFDESADIETLKLHMLDAINELVVQKHKINAEIALSEIYARLNIEGVSVVEELNEPKANIKAGKHQAPFCTSINIIEASV
ncbi:baseplate J/gp47 family protein [Caedibacter taeniospiralis]|jgi:phage-related baseplate assembly protein|uniref:baseplate assembly protein n=1 Tax=Caedibacter taeniospiralis TaxID=28907 RepID=UPI0037C155AB